MKKEKPKVENNKKKQKETEVDKIPELDETSAILAYTQDVKDSAGVKDSFTEEKTEKQIQEEK